MASFDYSEEQQALMQTARDFTRKEIVPVAGQLDEEGTFPHEICKKAWETGLMNCEVPEAYGGLGLACLSHCLVLEEISYGCTGINTTLAGNMLGSMPHHPVGHRGTEEDVLRAPAGRSPSSRRTAARSPTRGPTWRA